MIYPNWKIKLAEKCVSTKETSQFKDVNDLVSVLDGTCTNQRAIVEINRALEIYQKDLFIKEILEAALLCDDFSLDECARTTGIPACTIDIYSMYFFDTLVFKYKLHKHEYVRTYDNPDFPDAKLYKQWALSVGMDFIKWKFNAVDYAPAPPKIISSLMADTFFRAKEHLNEPITSSVAKESLKWLKYAIDTVGSLKSTEATKDNSIMNDIRIALEYKEHTKTNEEISDAEIVQ